MVILALGALSLLVPALQPPDDASTPAPRVRPAPTRVEAAYQRMGPRQRVGQLFMVGVDARGATAYERHEIADLRLGNVFLSGRNDAGRTRTAQLTRGLRTRASWRGVHPMVAVDQEGGAVQTLGGRGFSTIPAAGEQGRWRPAVLRSRARAWAGELATAGVNLDLAPVADVVPKAVGRANQPIGRYLRELGHRPAPTARKVEAFVRGMDDARVATSLKHFPGLGRASGNTDSSTGVTAPTGRNARSLRPFRAGVGAGADFVMVSSARYPHVDARHLACYSPVVLRTMLRQDLGFEGVAISDSFSTPALARAAPAARALRFLAAGGTMVLDTDARDLRPMADAVLDRSGTDPAFARVVRRAVLRVLAVKVGRGLVSA